MPVGAAGPVGQRAGLPGGRGDPPAGDRPRSPGAGGPPRVAGGRCAAVAAAPVEPRLIRGAAVIEGVLGRLVLAVVTGLIQAAGAPGGGSGQAFDAPGVAVIVGKALGVLVLAVVVGRWVSRVPFKLAARLPGEG